MAKRSAQTSGGVGSAEGASYTTRPLDASTWEPFAELVERNNGVYGGCWCIGFHSEYQRGVSDPRTLKEELVRSGRAHASLVFDEDEVAQGWCQYGSPEELGLKHHREYAKDPPPPAQWRITCIFVDKRYRKHGYAKVALAGALDQIAAQGGGVVEGYPHEIGEKRMSNSFVYNGTRTMYEQAGFEFIRSKGLKNTVMRRTIRSA